MATPKKNVDFDLIKKAEEIELVTQAPWSKDFKTIEVMIERGIGYKAIAEALSKKYNESISVNKLVSVYKKQYLNRKKK